MISGSYDHSVKVWDVKCGQCKMTLRCDTVVLLTVKIFYCADRGHSDAVLCLQFVGDTLVSGSSDQTIKVSYNINKITTISLLRCGVYHMDSVR